jgi:hypothetical protein
VVPAVADTGHLDFIDVPGLQLPRHKQQGDVRIRVVLVDGLQPPAAAEKVAGTLDGLAPVR